MNSGQESKASGRIEQVMQQQYDEILVNSGGSDSLRKNAPFPKQIYAESKKEEAKIKASSFSPHASGKQNQQIIQPEIVE